MVTTVPMEQDLLLSLAAQMGLTAMEHSLLALTSVSSVHLGNSAMVRPAKNNLTRKQRLVTNFQLTNQIF